MDDLTRWLLAQLDDDERVARASQAEPWNFYPDGHYGAVAEFLLRWSPVEPDGVLAKVEADRLIVGLHRLDERRNSCLACAGYTRVPCPTLRAMALPYADRPGYRDEWMPPPPNG